MNNEVVPVGTDIEKVNEKLKSLLKYTDDFDKSRDNIMEVIRVGQEALTEYSVLTSQSGSFKDYEALSGLMKTLVDANKTLLELHQITKKLAEEKESKKNSVDNPNAIKNYGNTNIIMVGSTKELLSVLKKTDDETDDV